MQTNFAEFRDFSTKYNEISGETKFRSKFVEFSKRLLFQSKRKFERPREFSNEISLRRSEISRLLIESSQRKFVFWMNIRKHCLLIFKREELEVSFSSVTQIIKKYKITGLMKKGVSTGRQTKLNPESQQFIEDQMRKDDETTSGRIQKKLGKRGVRVHSSTVRRCRKKLGWTLQQTRYCQLIRDANKVKRLEYAQRVLETGDTFDNVIFSDECSISLEQFRRTCYRKQSIKVYLLLLGIGVDFVFFM